MSLIEQYLNLLDDTDFTFASIYKIMTEHHAKSVFSESLKGGMVVKMTYGELFAMSDAIAAQIVARYQNAGDSCIGIYMDNSNEWVAAFWAILRTGFVPVLLNTRQDIAVTNRIVEKLKPVCVFTTDSRIDGCVDVAEFVQAGKGQTIEETWCDDIVMVTSGSTSEPKLIRHNGRTICRQIELTRDILRVNPTIKHNRKLEIRIMAFLPFYHIFGLVSTMMWFTFFGRTLIFLPDYSPKSIQNVSNRMEVTHFFAIPLVWEKIAASVLYEAEQQGKLKTLQKAVKFSNTLQSIWPALGTFVARQILFKDVRRKALGTNLNFCISGGGFIKPETVELLNGLGYSMYQGYGLTECGIVSVNLDRRPSKRNNSSCGPIFSDINYKLSDKGELLISQEDAFDAIFVDGSWLKRSGDYYSTNDKVVCDTLGLHILGRMDDVIIAENGENISPEAIEQKIDNGAFVSASVLYMTLEEKKQIVLALESDGKATGFEYANSLKKVFASIEALNLIERPSEVISIVGQVPYNMKGVDRKKLAAMLEAQELYYEKCELLDEEMLAHYKEEGYQTILSEVKQIFAEVAKKPVEEVTDTSNYINNLEGDSLGYVELLDQINAHFDVQIMLDEKILLTPAAFADCIFKLKSK